MENKELTPQNDTSTQPAARTLSAGEKVIEPLTPGLSIEMPTATESASSRATAAMPIRTQPPVTPNANLHISSSGNAFLTGSQIAAEKKKLPVGVYVIAAISLFGFITGFIDGSQTGTMYTVLLFVNLFLAIGLILRLNWARKFMVVLSALLLVLAAGSLLSLVGLQSRMQQRKADYEAAVSRIDQNRLSPSEKKTLETTRESIASAEKQTGNSIAVTYFRLGGSVIVALAIIVYLTRPNVKDIFDSSEA